MSLRQLGVRLLLPLVLGITAAALLVLLLSSGERPPAPVAATQGGCPATRGQSIEDSFFEPEERRSVDGVLSTTLKASAARAYVGQPNIASTLFEKQFPGPTLRVCQGDTLKIKFINDTKEPSNLHTHGLHVSPKGKGDNVLLDIPPGGSWQYEYKIPHDHPPGTYWYHPHRHGYTETQVLAGLAGMLIVDGKSYDDLPGIAGARERQLVIQGTKVKNGRVVDVNDFTNTGLRFFVNGRLRPKIDLAPGEVQRWRIVNASADFFVRLQIPGQRLNVISTDGNPLKATSAEKVVVLGAGERVEILVKGTSTPARLETTTFQQPYLNTKAAVLADINPTTPAAEEGTVPGALVPFEDLRRQKVDRKRTITYSRRKVGSQLEFLVNGKQFGHHRVDQTMKLNDLEEWTIKNTTNEWHTFHIHINPFQVVKIDGKGVDRAGYEDTVPIPPFGSVTLRQRYRSYTGQFVFHCHILGHEDAGMMSLVEIKK
ncbi:MAG: multicopper oxidase family protein [Solirubrobacteraceae bacterium]|nr:multicopper oxidase family protein [Solirubrobacteraceae bacterium]